MSDANEMVNCTRVSCAKMPLTRIKYISWVSASSFVIEFVEIFWHVVWKAVHTSEMMTVILNADEALSTQHIPPIYNQGYQTRHLLLVSPRIDSFSQ